MNEGWTEEELVEIGWRWIRIRGVVTWMVENDKLEEGLEELKKIRDEELGRCVEKIWEEER